MKESDVTCYGWDHQDIPGFNKHKEVTGDPSGQFPIGLTQDTDCRRLWRNWEGKWRQSKVKNVQLLIQNICTDNF